MRFYLFLLTLIVSSCPSLIIAQDVKDESHDGGWAYIQQGINANRFERMLDAEEARTRPLTGNEVMAACRQAYRTLDDEQRLRDYDRLKQRQENRQDLREVFTEVMYRRDYDAMQMKLQDYKNDQRIRRLEGSNQVQFNRLGAQVGQVDSRVVDLGNNIDRSFERAEHSRELNHNETTNAISHLSRDIAESNSSGGTEFSWDYPTSKTYASTSGSNYVGGYCVGGNCYQTGRGGAFAGSGSGNLGRIRLRTR